MKKRKIKINIVFGRASLYRPTRKNAHYIVNFFLILKRDLFENRLTKREFGSITRFLFKHFEFCLR